MDKKQPLFKPDKDWWNNACLSLYEDQTHTYISGYQHAVEILVAHIEEKKTQQDTLIYPIVFMYRHNFELLLKKIIQTGRFLNENELSLPAHHKLMDLWGEVKSILKTIEPSFGKSKEAKSIEHVLKELSEIDSNSTTFRYARTKEGKSSISNLRYINVRHLREMLSEPFSTLEGITYMLENMADAQIEMSDHQY